METGYGIRVGGERKSRPIDICKWRETAEPLNPIRENEMKKILFIDDDRLILEFVRDLLDGEGVEVVVAENVITALDYLHQKTPDVIFMDLIMPYVDGKTACRMIRGMPNLKDVYIVILSAILAEDPVDTLEIGANACIAKGPFAELSANILSVLEDPEGMSARCLSGEIIGLERIHPRIITRELLSAKKHVEAISGKVSQGIIEISPDGRIVFVNPAAFSIIGLPEDQLFGFQFIELFDQEDQDRVAQLLGDARLTENAIRYHLEIPFHDRLLSLEFLPEIDNKTPVAVIMTDVTEQRREESLLQASETRLRSIITKNSDAIIIVNDEGNVLFVNPAAETLFNRPADLFIGQHFGFPFAEGETTELDLLSGSDHIKVAEMRTVEIEWEGQNAYLASIRDITHLKAIEEELREANRKILEQQEQMIEEERLKVLLEMAGATAHEMNQPLTVLMGNIQLLEFCKDEPDMLAKTIDQIEDAGNRIADTVKKIQEIRHYQTKPYAGGKRIIQVDQGA